MSQKRKSEVEDLPERKRRCQLEDSSDRKRRRSAEETSGPEPKIFKEDFDFLKVRVVQTSFTSPAPVCLASPGLCHPTKVTPRTFPNNIWHLLLDEEEEEEVEEYDEVADDEELNDEELEEEEKVSFKAGSLSKRMLCLSSPGLCHRGTSITQRSFPTNIAELLPNESEEVEEEKVREEKVEIEKEDKENDEETLVDFFEETVEFGQAALSASPSLCLAPTLCPPCNMLPHVFTSRYYQS